jgi:hypothetical protein
VLAASLPNYIRLVQEVDHLKYIGAGHWRRKYRRRNNGCSRDLESIGKRSGATGMMESREAPETSETSFESN